MDHQGRDGGESMAIYHFNMKIIKRSAGRSVVSVIAHRSASRLFDERYQLIRNYQKNHQYLSYSEILAPLGSPEWVTDRSNLWNTIERMEKRKDAQLAREVMVALPIELSQEQQIELIKNFCKKSFISAGMIADANIHLDNPNNPHAHILLTLREIGLNGFGKKVIDWNKFKVIYKQRKDWEEETNEALSKAGFSQRVDCRSLKKRGIDLLPNIHLGSASHRAKNIDRGKSYDRCKEALSIKEENGKRIIENPGIALKSLKQQARFTDSDIFSFLKNNTSNSEQLNAAYDAILSNSGLVCLGAAENEERIYTVSDSNA